MEATLKLMPFRLDIRLKLSEVRKKSKLQHLTPKFPRQRRFGFSLIELLVVIAILGALATITSSALIGHQKKARDAQRKSDMQAFKKAMELARSNCRNSAYYPRTNGTQPYLIYDDMLNTLKNQLGYQQVSFNKDPLNPTNAAPNPLDDYGRFYGLLENSGAAINAACGSYGGRENFIAWARLEISNDKDAAQSRENCQQEVDNTVSGVKPNVWNEDVTQPIVDYKSFYYVCSD